MNKLTILLAEDHETVREGIKLLIETQPDMEVVGEAGNGDACLEMVKKLAPDLVVMDISMPQLNGLQATKKLKKAQPEIKILMLTRHTDDGYIQQLIRAGANGYVLKQSAPEELIRAVRAVASGAGYLDPALTQKVMSGYGIRSNTLRGETKAEITDRETEVLRLTAWGHSNKEIGVRMDISVKTVETHKANAMRKLGIGSRIDIVRYAILQGWLEDN